MTRALALVILLMSSAVLLMSAAFAGTAGSGSHGGGGGGGGGHVSVAGGHMSAGGHAGPGGSHAGPAGLGTAPGTGTHVMVANRPHTAAAKDARIATIAPAKPPRVSWWRRHFQHSNNSHNPPVESWCAEGRRSAPECLQSPGVPNAPAARR